jgi:hypothetical protein
MRCVHLFFPLQQDKSFANYINNEASGYLHGLQIDQIHRQETLS